MRPPLAPNIFPEDWGLGRARSEFWSRLGLRIACAGSLYPVLLVCVWGGITLTGEAIDGLAMGNTVGWRFEGRTLVGVGIMVPIVFFFTFQFFVVGFLWAGIVSLFVVPVAAMLRRLLEWPTHLDTTGKLTGGLVAYLATLPAALGASTIAADRHEFISALFVFAHCGLAIAMGQAAGCLAAVADLRRRRRGKLTASGLRFGVWQLLALTVPVAVVLSLLKVADLLNPPMALASIAAAFCAVATWQPVTWLVNRWLDRRLAKRRRRRLADCSTWNNSPS